MHLEGWIEDDKRKNGASWRDIPFASNSSGFSSIAFNGVRANMHSCENHSESSHRGQWICQMLELMRLKLFLYRFMNSTDRSLVLCVGCCPSFLIFIKFVM